MFKHIRALVALVALTVAAGAVLYPLAVYAFAQGLFPASANGSLIERDGKPVGSRLIAQEFKGDEWFRPRPSAAGYNAAASGGSNFGASNPKLRERIDEQLKADARPGPVAADAVLASGSGLDPHVTLSNARQQVERIVAARAKVGADGAQVRAAADAVLSELAFAPLGGLVGGEPLVNVLEANLELARSTGAR